MWLLGTFSVSDCFSVLWNSPRGEIHQNFLLMDIYKWVVQLGTVDTHIMNIFSGDVHAPLSHEFQLQNTSPKIKVTKISKIATEEH